MISNFKCPFCGEELVGVPNIAQTTTLGFRCYNIQCKAFNHFMPVFILQALIQAKQDLEFFKEEQDRSATALIERTKELDKCQKDLEIAVDALKRINETYEEEYYKGDDEHDSCDWLNCADDMDDIATNALEQIEHIADASKMIGHKE